VVDDSRRYLMLEVRGRRAEICHAILVRVRSIGPTGLVVDPEYLEGLRAAIGSAVDHTVESSLAVGDRPVPIPDEVTAQARLAARRNVPLETVLRRYLAGHFVFGDFVVEEAERRRLGPAVLRHILRSQATETDRVLAAISATYTQELKFTHALSGKRRIADRVRRLLDGELVDPDDLDYGFDRWHVGLLLQGPGGEAAVGLLASRLGARRMTVEGEDGLLWAWIGLREKPDLEGIPRRALTVPSEARVGVGEPCHGRAGWRLTHEQSRAALTVAVRGSASVVPYADVALLAAAMQDELLAASLHALYLEPLGEDRRDGKALRDTLRAYFTADGNVTSAAAALGVTRNTVTNRLRAIEARVGRLRPGRAGDLALALRLESVMETDRPIEPTGV
jgi:PucR C-terminal helix-turn-helix domain